MSFYNNSYWKCYNQSNNFSSGSFYSLFVGLNDKCKKIQIISTQEAIQYVENVCKQHFINGFTILIGSGADRGSSSGIENSIYIMAINANENSVFQVAKILQHEFNISEVLIEKNETQYLYFSK